MGWDDDRTVMLIALPTIHSPTNPYSPLPLMLRVYNTLSRTKEAFEPVRPGKVGIYLCGPTVYKPSHIGHMVGPVIFDAIKRYLTYSGYQVTLVVNITDVDDKLIAESKKRGVPMAQLAAEMTADYMSNIEALGVDAIDHFPRCTDTMDEIVEVHRNARREGFCLRGPGRRVLRGEQVPRLRQAEPSRRRGHARRRRRHGRAEAGRRRLRPVEGGQAGRALVAQPLGTRPARLAHRMLRHEPQAAGRNVRHPRRRPGPDVSAPRERNRPKRMLPRATDGQVLDAQRPDAGQQRGGQSRRPQHPARRRRPGRPRGRQDQQVEGLGPVQRDAQAVFRRDDPLLRPFDAIPPADRLQRRANPRSGNRHGHVLPLFQAVRAGHRRGVSTR